LSIGYAIDRIVKLKHASATQTTLHELFHSPTMITTCINFTFIRFIHPQQKPQYLIVVHIHCSQLSSHS